MGQHSMAGSIFCNKIEYGVLFHEIHILYPLLENGPWEPYSTMEYELKSLSREEVLVVLLILNAQIVFESCCHSVSFLEAPLYRRHTNDYLLTLILFHLKHI